MRKQTANVGRSLLILLSLVVATEARATKIAVLGAVTFPNYNTNPTLNSVKTDVSFGGGALLNFSLGSIFEVETGLLYLTQSYSPSDGNNLTYNYLTLPLLFRANPLQLLSFGVGGFYGINTLNRFTGNVADNSVQQIFRPGNAGPNDYGILADVGIRLPLTDTVRLRADATMAFGLANLSSGSATQQSRNVWVTAGIEFDL